MALEINNRYEPAKLARVVKQILFKDDATGVSFSTDTGSLHAYIDGWINQAGPCGIGQLQQIHEALGRFIEALIPEEVK